MNTPELTYSPDEETIALDEELREQEENAKLGATNITGMPRIWFMTRGSTTGIGTPLDLHYFDIQGIARYDVASDYQENRKIVLKDFGTAINSLMKEGKTRNGMIIQGGTSVKRHRLIFYLYT